MEPQAEAPYRTPSPPTIDVPDHAGERQPRAVYWSPPPPEVGTLVSAWSNQDEDGFPWKRMTPKLAALLTIILVPCIGLFLVAGYGWWGVPGTILIGVAIAGFGWFVTFESKQRPWCTYVGDAGFAEYKMTWRRPVNTVVRFDRVAGLYATVTEHSTNGVYRHTIADYDWCDSAGRVLAKQKLITHERGVAAAGARLGRGGRRNPAEDFIGVIVEAWRARRTASALAELEETGAIWFPVRRGRFLKIRAGSIETDLSGKTQILESGDIKRATLDSGVVTLKTKNGKLRFAVSEIADHSIAIALAETIGGVSLID